MLVSRSSLSVNDDTFHSIYIVSLPNTFRFCESQMKIRIGFGDVLRLLPHFMNSRDSNASDRRPNGRIFANGFILLVFAPHPIEFVAGYWLGEFVWIVGVQRKTVSGHRHNEWSPVFGSRQSDADYRNGDERKFVTTNIVNIVQFSSSARSLVWSVAPNSNHHSQNSPSTWKCSKREININQLKLNAPLAGLGDIKRVCHARNSHRV